MYQLHHSVVITSKLSQAVKHTWTGTVWNRLWPWADKVGKHRRACFTSAAEKTILKANKLLPGPGQLFTLGFGIRVMMLSIGLYCFLEVQSGTGRGQWDPKRLTLLVPSRPSGQSWPPVTLVGLGRGNTWPWSEMPGFTLTITGHDNNWGKCSQGTSVPSQCKRYASVFLIFMFYYFLFSTNIFNFLNNFISTFIITSSPASPNLPMLPYPPFKMMALSLIIIFF